MVDQLLVGGTTSLVNLLVHALIIAGLARALARLSVAHTGAPQYPQRTLIIVATGTLLFAGHFAEVELWALTYKLVGAAPPGTDLLYFAFGNYTTLGYGDILPVEQWRMLGPMTALNGIMLIGWSTALIIEILRRIMEKAGR